MYIPLNPTHFLFLKISKIYVNKYVIYFLKAEKLWCPNFKSRPCGCLQEYLSANGKCFNGIK